MNGQEKVGLPVLETALTKAVQSLAIDYGIVTAHGSAGANALTDSLRNWAPHIHKNRLVKIVSGQGAGQQATIQDNSATTLLIHGVWPQAIGAGAVYVILGVDIAQVLRDVFGGGSNISAANPLETHDPTVETVEGKVDDVEAKLDNPVMGLDALKNLSSYTEDTTSGDSGGDGAWHDALDVDTRGMKSFSAVVENTDAANSLNWRLRARASDYAGGADEEIPECPGSQTLGVGEKGLAELIKAYSRIKIQVQDTAPGSAASYTIDYLVNR